MLPGIDDGARELSAALQMAEMAVADGITLTACTPHIYPGLFENTVPGIKAACDAFKVELAAANIPLELTYGADIQIVPELVSGLQNGSLPTLHHSRYFLFEPPHHIAPPGMEQLLHNVLVSGFVPLITHPERLTYIDSYYDKFLAAAERGAWIQLTGGSITGRFGPRVQKVAERFLADGVTHIIASDGHNLRNRAPILSEAVAAAAVFLGEQEASRTVRERPQAVLDNVDPNEVTAPSALPPTGTSELKGGWFKRWLG